MNIPIAVLLAAVVALPACSSSPGLAMSQCSLDAGGPPCISGLMCMTFAAPAADGVCSSGGSACVLPCTTDTDCAPLGKGVSCSSVCGTSVCTPYQ